MICPTVSKHQPGFGFPTGNESQPGWCPGNQLQSSESTKQRLSGFLHCLLSKKPPPNPAQTQHNSKSTATEVSGEDQQNKTLKFFALVTLSSGWPLPEMVISQIMTNQLKMALKLPSILTFMFKMQISQGCWQNWSEFSVLFSQRRKLRQNHFSAATSPQIYTYIQFISLEILILYIV